MGEDEPLHLLCNEEWLRGIAWANSIWRRGPLLCSECYISEPSKLRPAAREVRLQKDERSMRLNVPPLAPYPLNDTALSYKQLTLKDTSRPSDKITTYSHPSFTKDVERISKETDGCEKMAFNLRPNLYPCPNKENKAAVWKHALFPRFTLNDRKQFSIRSSSCSARRKSESIKCMKFMVALSLQFFKLTGKFMRQPVFPSWWHKLSRLAFLLFGAK